MTKNPDENSTQNTTAGNAQALVGSPSNMVDPFKNVTKSPHTTVIPGLINAPAPEEINEYQSAEVLIKSIALEARKWRDELPEGYRPAVLAVLYGGIQIHLQNMTQVSFHGIRIEGSLNGNPCSMLTHQSTIQLLCYAEEILPEIVKNPIGFIWSSGKEEV